MLLVRNNAGIQVEKITQRTIVFFTEENPSPPAFIQIAGHGLVEIGEAVKKGLLIFCEETGTYEDAGILELHSKIEGNKNGSQIKP